MNGEAPSLGEAALRMSLWLGVVLGAIALLAWGAKRLGLAGATRAASPDAIRIVSRTALDARKSIMLISVRGRLLVVGVTPSEVSLLTEMTAEGSPPPVATHAFPDRLADAIRGGARAAAH